ncbi:hypothetical protein [Actinomadura sp. NPDC048394]|uniref:hypothetical protein n=1 Tax=Actinomadura sp. NPDC048394 TaxID=3158223 RepID=UPI0033DCA1C1
MIKAPVPRTLIAFLFLLAAISACSSNSGGDQKLQTMPAAEAKKRLDAYGRQVEKILGHGDAVWQQGVAGPCKERYKQLPGGASDPYDIVNFGRIENFPSEQMKTELTHLKEELEGQGWTTTKDTLESGKTILEASFRYGDGFSVVIEGMQRERRIVVSVGSPCLHRPSGDTET